ncbi:MAG: RnfABCDGE type electron transport complex subunit B [Planctomycetota bacterium]|jgi:RnfABCDGE-type electron transport complex B subunit
MLIMALVVMGIIGVALGIVLAWGGKRFAVEVDERVGNIDEALPGANCGACGYPGCPGYAEAIVNEGAAMNLCAPGGADLAQEIASIMGGEVEKTEPNYAVTCCQGGEVASLFDYVGVSDCRAASLSGIAGGRKACTYGCLGFGTCVKACPFGAMVLGVDRIPVIDEEKCTGCRRCVDSCPRSLNRVDSESTSVFVKCMSKDKGAVANKLCPHACIACKKCEKECPFDAIHIENNLAVIDYEKCKFCGKCVGVCPKNVIVNLRKERRERKKAREEKK